MADLIENAVSLGLLGDRYAREEVHQFLGMMQRFAELLPGRPSVEKIGKDVVRIIIEETDFENCSLILWNKEKGKLSLLAACGLQDILDRKPPAQYNRVLSFKPGEGIAGQVFEKKEPIFIEDVTENAIPPKTDAVIHPSCLACLPLMDLGVLNISGLRPQKFSPLLKRNWGVISKFISYLILQTFVSENSPQAVSALLDSLQKGPKTPSDEVFPGPDESRLSHQLLDHIPQGICILDRQAKVIRINEGIRKLQGDQSADVIGHSPSVFFHDPSIFDNLIQTASAEYQAHCGDVSLVGAQGELYLADIYLAQLRDNIGNSQGYLLVIDDITKKKALAEKVIRKEKLAALGTMAGGVAHDFNNLLMAMLGNIQMILHESADDEIRQRLQNIEKAVHDGAQIVRRLQKFTERDREYQSAATVNVSEAIRDVVELTRPRWKNAMEKDGLNLEIEQDLEPNCMAFIHPSDLREILTNLLFNSIEAMPEGGKITLKARRSEECIIIEVQDTGIGMDEEVAKKVFDPFFTTKGVGNSGLGLSVSWSLVNRNGGDIKVNSQKGAGTTFSVLLPRCDAAPETSVQTPFEQEADICRLLVIDDDPDVLEIIRDMLRLKGHDVVAQQDPVEALTLIERERFDLILTDLGMPAISGWEVAQSAKKKDPRIPVVLFTGWGMQYEEDDLSKRGVDFILTKPVTIEKLLATVDMALSSPKTSPN